MTTVKLGPIAVVLNRCYGVFGLSLAAYDWLKEWGSELVEGVEREDAVHFSMETWKPRTPDGRNFPNLRAHPDLVACVRALGAKASGSCSKLEIEEVALTIEIADYDGMERVVHR